MRGVILKKQMVICYELIKETADNFIEYFQEDDEITNEQIAQMTYHVMDFVFYHELGSALIDRYNLPVTGLEENAVDKFAVMSILFTENPDDSTFVGQDILYDVD